MRSMTLMNWVASTSRPKQSHKEVAGGVERIRHVSTKLRFGQCTVELPATTVSGQCQYEVGETQQARVAKDGIVTFQRVWRSNTKLKRAVRDLEFDAWYDGQSRERHLLAMLSSAVLAVVATFTLTICLYLSCAFNDEASLMWVGDVAQSLVVQVFVTEPTITVVVICAKLFISWVLLRVGKKRLKAQLQEQADDVKEQILTVSTRVEVAAAKAKALQVVAAGVTGAVAREKAAKTAEKRQCVSDLEGIAVAKGQLTQLRKTVARPKKIELETWDTRESELNQREHQTRGSLQAINAALDILGGGYDDAQQQLREAQATIMKLKHKLMKMEKENAALQRERAKVEDKTVPLVKPNAIAPVASHQSEPQADRAQMPVLQRAVRLCNEVCSNDTAAMADGASSNNRQHQRARGRHRHRRTKASRSAAINARGQHETIAATPTRRRTRKQRAMTWAEITALQRKLKVKAAKSAARVALRRRGRRGRTLDKLSPKAVKLVLDRREQRRQQLARRAARQRLRRAATCDLETMHL